MTDPKETKTQKRLRLRKEKQDAWIRWQLRMIREGLNEYHRVHRQKTYGGWL